MIASILTSKTYDPSADPGYSAEFADKPSSGATSKDSGESEEEQSEVGKEAKAEQELNYQRAKLTEYFRPTMLLSRLASLCGSERPESRKAELEEAILTTMVMQR
jgi:hypothetical protein